MEFHERENKSNVYCSVSGCKSKANGNPNVRFYHFPQKNSGVVQIINKFGNFELIHRRFAWIRALKVGKKVSNTMRVCSLHFKQEDFILSGLQMHEKKHIHLKKISVPSCNLPQGFSYNDNSKCKDKINSDRTFRANRRLDRFYYDETKSSTSVFDKNIQSDTAQEMCAENLQGGIVDNVMEENQNTALEKNEEKNFEKFASAERIATVDVSIQVESDFLVPHFIDFITSDHELSTITGISTFETLKTIEELVEEVQPINRCIKLSLRELIVMTLMKLKQNMTYALLAILFRFNHRDTCKKRILEMIDILSDCLKRAIVWPSKENILSNMPKCLAGFENVRVVVDCTEIRIQRPSNLCCQIQTYSYYKGAYTVKFMTGVTPAGLISFISKAYGGRASDNAIFEQRGIVKMLDKKDCVMADKGFTVEDLCKKTTLLSFRLFFKK